MDVIGNSNLIDEETQGQEGKERTEKQQEDSEILKCFHEKPPIRVRTYMKNYASKCK